MRSATQALLLLSTAVVAQQPPGTIETVVGLGRFIVPLNGLAKDAALFSVSAVAVSPKGTVYFAMGGGSRGRSLGNAWCAASSSALAPVFAREPKFRRPESIELDEGALCQQ